MANRPGNPNIIEAGMKTRFTSEIRPVNPGRKRNLLKALAEEDDISREDERRWWTHCRSLTADELKAVTTDTNLQAWQLEIARLQYKALTGDLKAWTALHDRFNGKPTQTIEQQQAVTIRSEKPVIVFSDGEQPGQ